MRPASSNSLKAFATDDWLGMVSIRIQRPRTRIWFTELNDCEPPETCITASVFPCVGLTAPTLRGIQSICALIIPLIAPWRSGDDHTWPCLCKGPDVGIGQDVEDPLGWPTELNAKWRHHDRPID